MLLLVLPGPVIDLPQSLTLTYLLFSLRMARSCCLEWPCCAF